MTVEAVYIDGVFRPISPVILRERSHATFEPKVVEADFSETVDERIYEILGRTHSAGETDLAARHNEHQ